MRPSSRRSRHRSTSFPIRRERGPFTSDDDLLLAAYYADGEYAALKEAGPIETEYPLTGTPLLTLVKEIVARPDITSFRLTGRSP